MTEQSPSLPPSAQPGGDTFPPPPPPPPGGGNYPPPPPPSGAYLPPPPGPVLRGLGRDEFTPWRTRVAAYVVDHLPLALILGIGWLVLETSVNSACLTNLTATAVEQICSTGPSPFGLTVMWIAALVGIGYFVWNFGYRQGITGSSLGKSLLGFTVVSEKTGEPIGFGLSVLRAFAHAVDAAIFYVGYLFPLWDAKRQTLADKMMATVCLPLVRPTQTEQRP